jgi:hypothetical protein
VSDVPGFATLPAPTRPVVGLLLQVDDPAVVLRLVPQTATGSWPWPVRWVDTIDGRPLVWCGERRRVQQLPVNTAAWALAARLGCPDLAERIGLNGHLLLAGIGADGRASDVPDLVVQAARQACLFAPPMLKIGEAGGGACTSGQVDG